LDGKDLNDALADCNESLRLQPNDDNTLNSGGLVQFKLGASYRALPKIVIIQPSASEVARSNIEIAS
jgi:hypothetical protein